MVTALELSALVSLLNRFAPQMTEVERLWCQDVLIPKMTPKTPQPVVDVPVVAAEGE